LQDTIDVVFVHIKRACRRIERLRHHLSVETSAVSCQLLGHA
jgi:hypothetical protein